MRTEVLPQYMEALRAAYASQSASADFHELRQGFIPTNQSEKTNITGNFTMTYWRLHYHIIWSTMDRQPILIPQVEKLFYGVIYRKADEMGLKIHGAGNVKDHVHVVLSIPPKLSVSDCVRHLKGASAFAINHKNGSDGQFKWQAGYGALTVGERSLKTVMEYAAKQKEHHKDRTMIDIYERIDDEE